MLDHETVSGYPNGVYRQRYEALDALRGICACMVAVMHLPTPGLLYRSMHNGYLFVDFFFVLSGFVIAASYGDKLAQGFSVGRFMFLRLGRVYPLHLAMLLAFAAFEIVTRKPLEGDYSMAGLISSLLLLQIFVGPDGATWNRPSWSIAAEVWTYLLFGLVARYARPVLVPACAGIIFTALMFLPADRHLNFLHDWALLRCLLGFSLGVLAHGARGYLAGRTIPHATLLETGIAALAAIMMAMQGALTMAIPFVFALAVLVFSFESGAVSRLLKTGPLLFLGTLSYSIYMVHLFVMYRTVNALSAAQHFTGLGVTRMVDGQAQVGGSPLFGDAVSLTFLLAVVGVAWCTYRLIELPGQRWSRKYGARREEAVTAF